MFLHLSSVNPHQLNSRPRVKISTLWPNKHAAHPVDHNWTGPAQVRISTSLAQRHISTHFAQSRISTNSFFKNHQNSHPLTSGHDFIHTPVLFPIWGFYDDICDCHILRARAWTALIVCTCTCTKPNSSKPNQTEWSDINKKKNPSAII